MQYKKYISSLGLTIGGETIETPGGLSKITTPAAGYLGQGIIQLAIQLTLLAAVLLTLVFLIWGGIDWILSGGDPKAVDAAKKKLTYAVIGLVVTFFSFFIVMAVGNFFGVQLFAPTSQTTVPGAPI